MSDDVIHKLRSTLARMEVALSHVREAICLTDDDGNIYWCNENFDVLVGMPHFELLGTSIHDYNHFINDETRKISTLFLQVLAAKMDAYHYCHVEADDETKYYSLFGNPLIDGGAVFVISDTSKRMLLQRQLLQSQKLESIGGLAAGVAHEINTPVQYIGDNLHFLLEEYDNLFDKLAKLEAQLLQTDDLTEIKEIVKGFKQALDFDYLQEEIPKAISQSLAGTAHITKIVRSIKAFAHPDVEQAIHQLPLHELIHDVISISTNEWKYVADMTLSLDESIGDVPVSRNEFNQALLNIIINAAHAISDQIKSGTKKKGKIHISTEALKDKVVVKIKDDGPGIPKVIQARIFDPFFTTKEVGRGTGQGLAIARSSIEKSMNGQVDFITKIGEGTCFVITLPRTHIDAT